MGRGAFRSRRGRGKLRRSPGRSPPSRLRALPALGALLATACFVPEYQAAQGAGAGGSPSASSSESASQSTGAAGGTGGAVSPFGQALLFSGASARIEAGQAPTLDLSRSSFTVELWFRPNSLPVYQALVVHGAGNPTQPGWAIFTTDDGITFHTADGSVGEHAGAASVLEVGHNHHIVVTRSGSDARILILDATAGQTKHVAAGRSALLPTWASPLDQPFELGGTYGGGNTIDFPVDGVVDDVRIWNVVLTNEEIDQKAGAPVSCREAGLIAYWSMDQTGGNAVPHCDTRDNLDLVIAGEGYEWVPSPF